MSIYPNKSIRLKWYWASHTTSHIKGVHCWFSSMNISTPKSGYHNPQYFNSPLRNKTSLLVQALDVSFFYKESIMTAREIKLNLLSMQFTVLHIILLIAFRGISLIKKKKKKAVFETFDLGCPMFWYAFNILSFLKSLAALFGMPVLISITIFPIFQFLIEKALLLHEWVKIGQSKRWSISRGQKANVTISFWTWAYFH